MAPEKHRQEAKLVLQLNPSQDYAAGHPLHGATPIRPGDLGALFSIQKQTQNSSQNGETKKQNNMKEQNTDPRIIELNNLTDAEFKTLVIKMLNEGKST